MLLNELWNIFHEKDFEAQVSLELYEDKKIPVPFIAKEQKWSLLPQLSEQSVKVAVKGEIAIHYMDQLHQTLYKTNIRSLRNFSKRSVITLQALELIDNDGWCTQRGQGVLNQLHVLGPPSGSKGLKMTAKELLDLYYASDRNPLRDYLEEHNLVSRIRSKYSITDHGNKWLEDRSVELLQRHFRPQCTLIKFLPMEYLNRFLVDPDTVIRGLAKERAQELQELQRNNPDVG
jgi:hypothetical protein